MPTPYQTLDWPAAEFRGVNLTASPDQLRRGEVCLAQNISTSILGQMSTRAGTVRVGPSLASVSGGAPIHSVFYLSDLVTNYPTLDYLFVVGAGTSLYGWNGTGAWTVLETGFSGNPLTGVPYRLSGTGTPWLIIGDSNKMVKITAQGLVYQLGIVPDPDPSTASVITLSNFVISTPTPTDGTTVSGVSASGADTASLSSLVRTTNYVVATSGSSNDYVAGMPVSIAAPSSLGFIGQFQIASVSSATQFAYYQGGSNATATGTLTASTGFIGTCSGGVAQFTKTVSLNLSVINGATSPISDAIQAWIYVSDITKFIAVQLFFNNMNAQVQSQLSNGWNLVSVPKSGFTTRTPTGTRASVPSDWVSITSWSVAFTPTLLSTPVIGVAQLFIQASGPDTSVGVGYDYRDTYYDDVTQSESNPSPIMANDVYPINQAVGLAPGSPSTDPQVTTIRWWRRGGTLASNWYLVGTQPNLPVATISTAAMNSAGTVATITTAADHGFSMGDTVYIAGVSATVFDGFFTIASVPTLASFTVANTVAGGSVSGTGGTAQEAFIDTLPDIAIATAPTLSLNNDVPVTTINQSGTIVYGQPLSKIWGPYGGTEIFGCGDPNQPGYLYWCNPSNPDGWGSLNTVEVTQSSDPLLNGTYWNGNPYVRSIEYVGQIQPASAVGFYQTQDIGAGESLAAAWALLGGPGLPFMPYVGKSGIFVSSGGTGESLTDETLWPLFDPQSARTDAVDWTYPQFNRLAFYDHHLRWTYQGKDGVKRFYLYNVSRKYWTGPHAYAFGGTYEFVQPEVEETLLVGGADGNLYQWDTAATTDAGTAINALIQSAVYKPAGWESDAEWGHINVDSTAPVGSLTVQASFNTTQNAFNTVGTCVNLSRGVTPIGLGDQYSTGAGFQFSWTGPGTLFGYSILWRNDGQSITHSETPATSFGSTDFQHLYRANVAMRSTGIVNCTVVVDNVQLTPQPIPSTGNTRLRQQIFFPLNKGQLYQIKLDAVISNQKFKVYPEDSSAEFLGWSDVQYREVQLPFTGGNSGG